MSRPEGEITRIGLSMYVRPPFMETGALQESPPSWDVNSCTPGSYWSKNATKIGPQPHAGLVLLAMRIWGSNCHPMVLQAAPHTKVSGPKVVPPSVERRNRTLVPGQFPLQACALMPVINW